MKIRTIDIATTGILCALIAVITLIPYVGFIPIIPGFVSIAAFGIALMLVGGQTQNALIAVAVSTFFGLMSMTSAFISPTSILDMLCQNPLLSVLPRVFIGLTTYYSYKGFCKLFKNTKTKFTRNYLPSSLSAIIGTLTNTVLFLSMLLLLYWGTDIGDGVLVDWKLIASILLFNTIAEVVFSAIVVPPIVVGVNKFLRKNSAYNAGKEAKVEATLVESESVNEEENEKETGILEQEKNTNSLLEE